MLPIFTESSTSLINIIETLTNQVTGSMMSDDERALTQEMKKTFIEKFILENHHNAVSTYKTTNSGKEYVTYTTRVPGGKRISAQSKELLSEKLYLFYSGKKDRETATFASLFPEALEWHTIKKNNSDRTKKRNEMLYNARIRGSKFEFLPIKDIDSDLIEEFLCSFSNSICRNELCNIKTLINFTFEYARKNKIIPSNIATTVSTKEIIQTTFRPLEFQQKTS